MIKSTLKSGSIIFNLIFRRNVDVNDRRRQIVRYKRRCYYNWNTKYSGFKVIIPDYEEVRKRFPYLIEDNGISKEELEKTIELLNKCFPMNEITDPEYWVRSMVKSMKYNQNIVLR